MHLGPADAMQFALLNKSFCYPMDHSASHCVGVYTSEAEEVGSSPRACAGSADSSQPQCRISASASRCLPPRD